MAVPAPKPVSPFRRRVQSVHGLGAALMISATLPPLWWDRFGYWTLLGSLGLLCAGAFAYADPKAREAQQAIAGGRAIAHWKYTESERMAWESHVRAAGMAQARRQAILIFIAATVVPVLMTWTSGVQGALQFALLPVVLPLGVLWLRRSEVNGACARAVDPGRETYVSNDGIWADGRLFLFDRMRNLELVWGMLAYVRFSVAGDDSPEVQVQIPRGSEKEAAQLFERFTPPRQISDTLGVAPADMM